MSSKANPAKIHPKLAALIAQISDADARRGLFQTLVTLANDRERPLGTAGLSGIDGQMEQVSRYLSKVAQAENAARGGAGSTRYTVLANLAALVSGTFRDGRGDKVGAMSPEEACAYVRRSAQMATSTASDEHAARPDYAALFGGANDA